MASIKKINTRKYKITVSNGYRPDGRNIVDGYEGILTINRSRSAVPGKGIVEGTTKNGRSRTIYMSGDMMNFVRSYCYDKRQEALDGGFPFSDYLFTNENSELMHPDTFTKYLRHYFVSTMLHNGVDKQTVAELAGHGDTGFLERTYCHPQMQLKQKAANQFTRSVFFGGSVTSSATA